jgi:DNA-binding beta-propeller fold protein YncE
MPGATGLAFDSAGNLFVANYGISQPGEGSISKITPNGAQSTFVSGLSYPNGLAFNSADDLFISEGGIIDEITPDGVQNTFAIGDIGTALTIQPAPEPSVLGLLAIGATALLVRRRQQQ